MAVQRVGAPRSAAVAAPALRADAPAAPRRRRRRRLGLGAAGGAAILLTAVLAGLLAPLLAPYGYDDQDLERGVQPPVWVGGSWTNALGTDQLGRDMLSRLMYGARTSILLAGTGVVLAAVLGVFLGLVSGYFSARLDGLIMRIADVQLSFPYLLLAIAFMALLGTQISNLVIVLVLRSWVVYARLVRVSVLSTKEREFVTAARALGLGNWRIVWRHVAPNVAAATIVVSTLQLAELIIVESSLSFLGLGVQPPIPSWGSMVSQGRDYISTAWWLVTLPGLAIVLTVLGTNLFGDGLRDVLDPRLKRA
jgi:ABC-type dipeptide/oligopeptide/nickel transport system permease subunit